MTGSGRPLTSSVALAAVLLAIGLIGMSLFASPARASGAFGVEAFESAIEDRGNAPAVQAGSHPYALTTAITFDHVVTKEREDFKENEEEEEVPLGEPEVFARIYGNPRHLALDLPAGLIVDPAAAGVRCTEAQLETNPGAGGTCPAASAVGIATVYLSGLGEKTKAAVYEMQPSAGVPAELGVNAGGAGSVFHIVGRLRTSGDYGFSAEVSEIGETASIYGLKITLWGDPSEAGHDPQRGVCASRGPAQKAIEEEAFEYENRRNGKSSREYRFSCPVEETDMPLLTMPGSCSGEALETRMSVDSWQDPAAIEPPPAISPPVTGCERLSFTPSLNVAPAPASPLAESPSGLNLDLKIPHEESTQGLAQADLQSMTVTLPAGMAISPSLAGGLGACAPAQVDLRGEAPPSCPQASMLGDVEVLTPLLDAPLKGAVYLAQPDTFEESLLGLYVVAEGDGVQVKLGARATLDPGSGQVTLTLNGSPQLPVGELELSLFGGPRAPLQAPTDCGSYTIVSRLSPWSGGPPARRMSDFAIGSGCGHRFVPSFIAGTSDGRAGAFSPLSVTVSRRDGEQRLARVRVLAPPGLLGALGSVPRCPEAQARAGECPPASEIGRATLAAGPGADPYWLQGGRIYLTGPYAGAPFGLAIEVPVEIGSPPARFDLGTALVRARIWVDPHTAQIAIESDPLPEILHGVPLDLRTLNLTIDRPGFISNPTSCSPLEVIGTLTSLAGANAAVSSPFEAVDCASLTFKPKLAVFTRARTRRSRGASLRVKIAAGADQANFAKIRLILPRRLPARLTTLQRACPDTTFDARPEACPAASVVGAASVSTRLLSRPLAGRAYLVSHRTAFPDLVLVLAGEGITLYLDGNLDIHKGLTSATFNSIPDVPIETFEAVFPAGPHSILASALPARARGRVCRRSLRMLAELIAQNGARVTHWTKIAVAGCRRGKRKSKKAMHTRAKRKATANRRGRAMRARKGKR